MSKENRAKWVAALRSGEYSQTRGRLKDSMGFCCLGVACEVYRKETGLGEWRSLMRRSAFHTALSWDAAQLPPEVAAWLDIDVGGQFRNTYAGRISLVGLNDASGFTFEQIADVIENHSKNLLPYNEQLK